MDTNSKAKAKIREHKEFLEVIEKCWDKFLWAQDFTTFPEIQDMSERVLEVISDIRQETEDTVEDLEGRIEEFEQRLSEYIAENEVEV